MRKGWTETTLGELVKIQKGKKPPALDVCEEASHPYLTADVLRGATREQFVSDALAGLCIQLSGRETVLLWDGAGAGDVFKSQPGILASTMAKLEARDSLAMDNGYLYLYLNFKQVAIKSSCRGTTVPHVSPEALKALSVSLPPLAEQKRIVDVVSSVDAYIDALQQQAVTARTARNAVLHELLSAGGDDWTETTLGDVLAIQSGFAFSTNDWAVEGYPVIKINNVRDGKVSTESCSFIADPIPQGAEKFLLKTGDLLITLTGEIGATGTVDQTFPMYLNQRVGRVSIHKESKVLLQYLAVLFNYPPVRAEMWSLGKGNAQLNISPKSIHEIEVNLPPLPEQRRIVEIVSSMDEMIQSTEQAVLEAKNLRSGLLSDLLSGDHEIPESYDRLLGPA